MITNEDWYRFIQDFFGSENNPEWIGHIVSNWNYNMGVPGCKCKYARYTPPIYCDDYIMIMETRIHEMD